MTKNIFKILYYLSLAFIGISLVAGCADKSVKPWDTNSLARITFSFTDTDNEEGEIAGNISLELPVALKPAGVASYVIYWGNSASSAGKADKLAEVAIADFTGTVLYIVPENTKIAGQYFLLFLKGTNNQELFSGKASLVADKFEGAVVPEVTDITQSPPAQEETPVQATEQAAVTPTTPTAAVAQPVETPAAKAQPSDQPQVVTRQADTGTLVVTIENVLFEFDKSYLRNEFKEQLQKEFSDVQNKDRVRLLIAGHADERGSNEYNLALGERRAFSVKRYLISLGFQTDNIRIISYGEEKPVDAAHNEEAWTKNRRAETEIQ
jgi:peptidoglycan-associated lipoprotein